MALNNEVGIFLLALLGLAAAAATSVQAGHDHHRRIDSDAPLAVSKLLQSYNLPAGLFPTSVVSSLSYEEDDESFQMNLERPCYAKFEDELVWYGEEIKGKIQAGRIEDLSGIQVREYLVWLPVTGIHVDDPKTGFVYFEVGPGYRRLSASAFQYPPACSSEAASYLCLFFNN